MGPMFESLFFLFLLIRIMLNYVAAVLLLGHLVE